MCLVRKLEQSPKWEMRNNQEGRKGRGPWGRRTRRRDNGEPANPPSTFCYLSAQRDALGQLVHSHLAMEVALLGATLHLVDDDRAHHTGDQEGSRAVDNDLQVERRGHHGWSLFQGWVSVDRVSAGHGDFTHDSVPHEKPSTCPFPLGSWHPRTWEPLR